jgi:hypothetical protein
MFDQYAELAFNVAAVVGFGAVAFLGLDRALARVHRWQVRRNLRRSGMVCS